MVSSDFEVFNYAKKCYCEAMKSEDFIKRYFRNNEGKEENERISSLEKQQDEFKKLLESNDAYYFYFIFTYGSAFG